MANVQVETELSELVKTYTDYLDAELGQARARVVDLVQRNGRRLIIDLNNLREYQRDLWSRLLSNPMEHIPAFEKAVKAVVLSIYEGQHGDLSEEEFSVGFDGSIPQSEVSPRTLMASFIGKVVLLEGIVTRCSLSRPKVRKSVHYCQKTLAFHYREYRDATMIGTEVVTSSVYPTEDGEKNPLQTEFGLCKFSDFQTLSIQEMPEKAPTGQLPRSVDVILHADLVDTVKPGDRVRIYGVYRSMGGLASNQNAAPSFRTLVIANNVVSLTKSVYQKAISDTDIETIKKISKRKNIFDLLATSLAPSIHGNETLKKAVLLMLLGGTEKNLENGTHIRGDINILMVGDPSTAKSQMLRFVLKMAPLAIATTGRGSSGVGLTAAVVSDKDTGERRLEAGAMVLADRGIICIDEFDKMSDVDRVAIHEVMEQQTVTIAKAGIHTSLNARCSVFAAANPQYGQYDNSLSASVNTALPDSLMSRFDLVFIILDQINPALDRVLATHILNLHSFIPPGVDEGQPIDDLMNTLCLADAQEEQEDDESPYEKHHPLLRVGGKAVANSILKVSFLKKYIHYAKSRIKPQLTEEACDHIGSKYVDFREKAASLSGDRSTKVFPVTARSLESMIRLATAHARARLSAKIEKKDAEAAVDLMNYSIFRELVEKEPPKKKKLKTRNEAVSEDEDDSADDENGEDSDSGKKSRRVSRAAVSKTPRTLPTSEADDLMPKGRRSSRFGTSEVGSSGVLSQLLDAAATSSQRDVSINLSSVAESASLPVISNDRFAEFQTHLNAVRMRVCTGSSLAIDLMTLEVNKLASRKFTQDEFDAAMRNMQLDGRIMHADDVLIFLG